MSCGRAIKIHTKFENVLAELLLLIIVRVGWSISQPALWVQNQVLKPVLGVQYTIMSCCLNFDITLLVLMLMGKNSTEGTNQFLIQLKTS